MRFHLVFASACAVLFGSSAIARADVCQVPSSAYATIQAAVDDPICTEIQLAGDTFVEDVTIERGLSMNGVSPSATTIAGRISLDGAATVVTFTDLTVDGSHPAVGGCFLEALEVRGGARLSGNNIIVFNGSGTACLIYGNDFEDGTTSGWSLTVP